MKKLLIVEDDNNLRESIIDYFSMQDEFIKGADSVDEALKLCKKHNFDIIITDLNLKRKYYCQL